MGKLNEAQVNLSIADLNSSDLQALSQILSLAGQAEQASGLMGSVGADPYDTMGSMSGPDGDMSSDVGAIDMNTQPIGDMGADLGSDMDMELDLGDDMGLESEVDEPMGMDFPDNDEPFGDDMGTDEFSADLGLDDEGDMEANDMEMMEEFNRMMHLAGVRISENTDMDEELDETEEMDEEEMIEESFDDEDEQLDEMRGAEGDYSAHKYWKNTPERQVKQHEPEEGIPTSNKQGNPHDSSTWALAEGEDEDEMEIVETTQTRMRESMKSIRDIVESDEDLGEEEHLDENAEGLYNLDLDEDAVEEMKSPGIGDNRVFGPYPNEQACMIDARKEIPGAMRNKEVSLTHKPDGWYWNKLNVNEDATNSRPNLTDYCDKGIKSDKHAQVKVTGKPGDNTLFDVMESTSDLASQLNERFAKFMKGE